MLTTESSTTASVRVIEAVSAATGRSTAALPPLYDAIDPEALDEFVRAGGPGTEICFEYFDIDVTVAVEDDSEVSVRIE